MMTTALHRQRHINPRLSSPAQPHWGPLVLRRATSADRVALQRLAELDSAQRPDGAVLLAALGGRLVAAIGLDDGTVIADPFVPTSDIVGLLRLRATQLNGCDDLRRRRVRRARARAVEAHGGA